MLQLQQFSNSLHGVALTIGHVFSIDNVVTVLPDKVSQW